MRVFSFLLGPSAASAISSVSGHKYQTKRPVVFPVTLTWEAGAPDGFTRQMIKVNGQSPGPLLSIKEGDSVEFTVKNNLPYNTTVHFHGIEQSGTPWSDGVPGLSQKPIEPGCSFVYKWTATQYGIYWYNAHARGLVSDGLYGPIHIRPKKGTATPFKTISNDSKVLKTIQNAVHSPEVVTLSDWNHFTSAEVRTVSLAANVDSLCGHSMLINGKGSVLCPGVPFLMSLIPPPILPLLVGLNLTDTGCLPVEDPLVQTTGKHDYSAIPAGYFSGCKATNSPGATIFVDPSKKWASLNLISTASLQDFMFSIDEHPLWVYEVDGRYIVPQLVDGVAVSQGTRISVLVQLNKPTRAYTIRLANPGLNQKIFASATLAYGHGHLTNIPKPSIDYGGANTTANVRFFDDSLIVPFPPVQPAEVADETFKLVISRQNTAWTWVLDGIAFNETLEDLTPLLWKPIDIPQLTIKTRNGSWVDLIIQVTNETGLQPPHPLHKHSKKFHVIGAGPGLFPWKNTAEAIKAVPQFFNLDNPPYKDGFNTLPVLTDPTWSVIRYQVVNPGAFLFHCHINPHLTGGMAIAILDGYDKWPEVPKAYGPGGNGFQQTIEDI